MSRLGKRFFVVWNWEGQKRYAVDNVWPCSWCDTQDAAKHMTIRNAMDMVVCATEWSPRLYHNKLTVGFDG